jgi:hypothetical protein
MLALPPTEHEQEILGRLRDVAKALIVDRAARFRSKGLVTTLDIGNGLVVVVKLTIRRHRYPRLPKDSHSEAAIKLP